MSQTHTLLPIYCKTILVAHMLVIAVANFDTGVGLGVCVDY